MSPVRVSEGMSANAASVDISERDGTRRIDVTTIRIGHVADFAETKLGDDTIGSGCRGDWTYLVAKETR